MFTDIHWGKKANSVTHNQDCLNFIEWFCDQVRKDPEIDHIVFLGDWHENRSSINISTLKFSHQGAKLLNDLGLPIYFIVGNHDLYYRHTREIHSLVHFEEFTNIKIIEDNYIAPASEIEGGALFSPFLFHDEYENLENYLDIPVWMGHYEFKGFQVTGYGLVMPTGPEALDFEGPDFIFSGHFHKRQANQNVVYIGNTFPMDFGDAGDTNRGMATYKYADKDVQFIDWDDCPKYVRIALSDLIEKQEPLPNQARVKCIVDIPINFEESTTLRTNFLETYNLREFVLEESSELVDALTNTDTKVDINEDDLATVDDLVIQMLTDIDHEQIDNEFLINIYRGVGEE